MLIHDSSQSRSCATQRSACRPTDVDPPLPQVPYLPTCSGVDEADFWEGFSTRGVGFNLSAPKEYIFDVRGGGCASEEWGAESGCLCVPAALSVADRCPATAGQARLPASSGHAPKPAPCCRPHLSLAPCLYPCPPCSKSCLLSSQAWCWAAWRSSASCPSWSGSSSAGAAPAARCPAAAGAAAAGRSQRRLPTPEQSSSLSLQWITRRAVYVLWWGGDGCLGVSLP